MSRDRVGSGATFAQYAGFMGERSVAAKRILGIDPGSEASGVVVLEVGESPRVLWSDKAMDNRQVRGELIDNVFFEQRGCYEVVIESLTPRMTPLGWSTLDTILWVGRIYECAVQSFGDDRVHMMHRDEIKRRLLGKTNAKAADSHIRQLLVDQVGEKGVKAAPGPTFGVSSHAWQALAAVWAHLHPDGA